MKRRTAGSIAALVLALAAAAQAGPPLDVNPLHPASTGGVAAVDRALARLSTHRRLLVIAAHPDDEDTSLLTLVSRGMGGEAAYLSLSRGEGGQNLIGPGLGVDLGLIRSRELLAARAVDGGRQYFTRAFDFGFTRSLDETWRLWPKEVLLEDVVRVIRRFKPQVVVSVFPGVPSQTHGQHQAAGISAHEAFPLAGDPAALARLAEEGLVPWQPQALYRSTFFDRNATSLVMPTSGIDPYTGKSIYQLAVASRSMHRSQDMGQIQRLGPQEARLGWVQGGAGVEGKDVFAGIDTSLPAMTEPLADPEAKRHVREHLEAVQVAAERARGRLNPARLAEAVPDLLEILKHLRAVAAFLEEKGAVPGAQPVRELIAEKLAIAEAGLAAAAGIAIDASTERETLIAGETFPVQASLWTSGALALEQVTVELVAAEWAAPPVTGEVKPLAAGALGTWDLTPTVPAAAPATVPYFLERPMLGGGLYDWSAAPPAVRGEPFGPPPLVARFSFVADGVPVTLEREVVHRHRDQVLGEIRRPLAVVPKVEVHPAEPLLLWPVAQQSPRRLAVTVTSHARETVRGRLETALQDGWPAPAPVAFALEPEEEKVLEVILPPSPRLRPGTYRAGLAAVLEDGARFSLAVPVLDYPHIRATPRPVAGDVEIAAIDLELPPLERVGYVLGASDRVPQFLLQAGIPLQLLGPADLLEGDLGRFDAVVVGSRAYETDPALARANPRLLDYARAGGLLLVQYQQYQFIEGKYAPLPLEIGRPHDRVTDETAPVRLLDPAHPVWSVPNRIVPSDWDGWVQERGLYFAKTWDPAYQPLLALADSGGPELQGGLLVAPLGKGTYVYTGLAFFRQLPAGVPGAYRLFANLLALRGAAGN